MRNVILFIHIEKVAGTSLSSIFIQVLNHFYSLKNWNIWSNSTEATFTSNEFKCLLTIAPFIRGLSGHSLRGYIDYSLTSRNVKRVTFLRNPIDRYISHYRHQKYKKGIDWDINSFLQEERFSNLITKRFSKSGNVDEAINNIKKIDFVGLQEKFNESIEMMGYFLEEEIAVENYFINLNKQPSKEEELFLSDPLIHQKIIDQNKDDLEIYKYVLNSIYPKQQNDFSIESNNKEKLKVNPRKIRINSYFKKLIIRPVELLIHYGFK